MKTQERSKLFLSKFYGKIYIIYGYGKFIKWSDKM